MALKFPNGSQFGISTAISSVITASAITNSNPAEVTTAAGALSNGDVVVIESSHPMLNNLATRVGTVAGTGSKLLGLDTSSKKHSGQNCGTDCEGRACTRTRSRLCRRSAQRQILRTHGKQITQRRPSQPTRRHWAIHARIYGGHTNVGRYPG